MTSSIRVALIVLGLLLAQTAGVRPGLAADYPRHIDSTVMAVEEVDPEALYMLYHLILNGMIVENLTIQEEWFKWADKVVSLPDMTELLRDYTGTLKVESSHLNLTKHYFDLAFSYASKLDLANTRVAFFEALKHLGKANETIPEIRFKTERIGGKLKAPPVILREDIDDLQGLIDEYADLAQALVNLLEGQELTEEEKKLVEDKLKEYGDLDYIKEVIGQGLDPRQLYPTTLSLTLNASECIVGGKLHVSGALLSRGTPLTGRRVSVKMGGVLAATAVTGDDGVYNAVVDVPFIYQKHITLRSEYWPSGSDTGLYTPSFSEELTLELIYYTPIILLGPLGVVLPGGTYVVGGHVNHGETSLGELRVNGKLGAIEAHSICDESGGFTLSFSVPETLRGGGIVLTVESEPRGVYGPGQVAINLLVVRYPSTVQLDEPPWITSGLENRLTGTVQVQGEPLQGCEVWLLGVSGPWVTGADGAFKATLRAPLVAFTSKLQYRVEAKPVEPWILGSGASGVITVLNPFTLIAGVVVAGLGLRLGSRRLRGWRVALPASPEEPPVEKPLEEPAAAPIDSVSFSGLYSLALEAVRRVTGLVIGRSETLREYLAAVKDRLEGGVYALFERLTLVYERWLYGRPVEVSLEPIREMVAGLRGRHEDEG